jgi:hypothetical protein
MFLRSEFVSIYIKEICFEERCTTKSAAYRAFLGVTHGLPGA